VLIEKGNSKHYAPSFVGGDPKEAIVFYHRAITNLNGSNQTRSWWYLNTLTQIALAAEKAKDYKLASKTYKEILSIEPNFKWVKDELYPRFLKKAGPI
jgi:tetratricopeptide (TPR) repeat protein